MSNTNILASAILATSVLAAGIALPGVASAKDWIEKVQIRQGIDVVPIYVSANKGGYTGIKTKSHTFLLDLYARASSGERIVALQLGASSDVSYFEYSDLWGKSFDNRDVGAGSKRTVSIGYDAKLPMKQIYWYGPNPKRACELNLQHLMNKGMKKQEILSKERTVTVHASFGLDAVAARKNKAKKGYNKKSSKGWNMMNTTTQTAGYKYEVRVVCGAGNNKVGG